MYLNQNLLSNIKVRDIINNDIEVKRRVKNQRTKKIKPVKNRKKKILSFLFVK